MAPEVGLEPTTTRLTAACSTIELLWKPNGRKSYNWLRSASICFGSDLALPSEFIPLTVSVEAEKMHIAHTGI
jgi:hypothetical protein